DDGSAVALHPYSVSEHSYEIRPIQPVAGRAFGVFFVHDRETLDRHYERNPADPRTTQQVVLVVDEFGNPRRTVAIAYPRRQPVALEQGKPWATVTEIDVENHPGSGGAGDADFYRLGVPIETKT